LVELGDLRLAPPACAPDGKRDESGDDGANDHCSE